MLKHITILFAGAICISAACTAHAQDVESVKKLSRWATGSAQNTSEADKMVARQTFFAPKNASGIRLHFERGQMGEDAVIRILTPFDRRTLVLNDKKLSGFKFSTPFLNGNKAIVEFWVRSKGASRGIAVKGIEAMMPRSQGFAESICGGSDDRASSNIPPIARMMGELKDLGGCTGTLISENCMVSAGHCAPEYLNIAQFNVPKSNDDKSLNHPKPEDQYPIQKIYDFQNEDEGKDWSVYRLQPNPVTGKSAGSVQGAFTIRTQMTRPGDRIRISGFGKANGALHATQQTHAAIVKSIDGTTIIHEVDTEPGNSGSTIIHEDSKEIIGIHTHGGCSMGGNRGTLIVAHERFKKAIAACLAEDKREGFKVGRNR